MKPEAEAGQIALKEERHQYILELLGSEGRVLAADLRVDTGFLKTPFVEICANWRVRERSNGYTAAPCLAVPSPFLSCLANKSTWRARSELLEQRLK